MIKRWLRACVEWVLAHLIILLIYLIVKSCRVEVHGLDPFREKAMHTPCILVSWHNQICLLPHILGTQARPLIFRPVISKSRDANLLDRVVKMYPPNAAIRVPHDAKSQAMRTILKSIGKGVVPIFTPDGPRGPRYSIKEGVIFAALAGKAQLVPMLWEASRFWELPTWDGLRIPKPFSKLVFRFGEGYTPKREKGKDLSAEVDTLRKKLETLFAGS
jgi:lysophospholipid acyltransferase (LPLAT)-like uncharacterized protein